jgi:hypothetical protein
VLRSVAAIIVELTGTAFGQVDFYEFDNALWEVAQSVRAGVITAPLELASQTGNLYYIPYTTVYSPVYVIFGHRSLLMRFMFALIGTLFVFNAYRLGRAAYTERAGLYTAGFAAVFPYWLYLSAIFYRDMLIMLVLSQILLIAIESDQTKIIFSVINLTGLSIVAIMLRPENAPVVGILFMMYVYNLLKCVDYIPSIVSNVIIIPIAIIAINTVREQILSISIRRMNRLIDGLARSGGAYLTNISFNTWSAVFSFASIGSVYFLFVPFPWQLHNTLALVAFLQNLIIWYPIAFISLLGFPYVYSRNRFIGITLVAFAISGIVPYGLIERNMGPALRHRSQFQIPFFVCAAVWIEERFRFKFSILDSHE